MKKYFVLVFAAVFCIGLAGVSLVGEEAGQDRNNERSQEKQDIMGIIKAKQEYQKTLMEQLNALKMTQKAKEDAERKTRYEEMKEIRSKDPKKFEEYQAQMEAERKANEGKELADLKQKDPAEFDMLMQIKKMETDLRDLRDKLDKYRAERMKKEEAEMKTKSDEMNSLKEKDPKKFEEETAKYYAQQKAEREKELNELKDKSPALYDIRLQMMKNEEEIRALYKKYEDKMKEEKANYEQKGKGEIPGTPVTEEQKK